MLSRWVRSMAIVLWLCCSNSMASQAPGWFDGDRPALAARQAVALLGAAQTHGLVPQDYSASALQQALAQATQDTPLQAAEIARLDQALSTAMERYLSDLHQGRIKPQTIHHNFSWQRQPFDAKGYLQAALEAGRLPEAASEAAPQLLLYAQLRMALAHYREQLAHPAWDQSLPPLPGAGQAAKVVPGQAYAGLGLLAQRLAALGDLAPELTAPARYEGALVDALKAFQQRHGLEPDGVIGRATLAQLQVMPAQRVRQIELTLERLRWTPLTQGPRMIVINIPEFVLRAYEVQDGRIHVQQEMKVVVGKAMDTRTPLFDEDMRFIEFSPYWNVPPSIARAEIVPRLQRDPDYLARQGMEFVSADGRVNTEVSPVQLDAVLAGRARIRQRPGPKNALGDIKFVFPNHDNIYLHHTPATELFGRARRDFSHGCIRVEQPVALAAFVLRNQSGWSQERIVQAMRQGQSNTLRLTEPIPVLIAYATALARNARIYFYQDIYGLDRQLDAALRQRHLPLIKESTP